MNRHPIARAALVAAIIAAAILGAGPAVGQAGPKADPQGKDELWDVTTQMEIPGMPMAMPGRSMRVCVEKGSDAGMVPKNEGCTLADTKRVGAKLTYRMQCKSGKNDYVATGESTATQSGYQGRMQMTGKVEGEQMDMALAYSGTRAGNCTAAR